MRAVEVESRHEMVKAVRAFGYGGLA